MQGQGKTPSIMEHKEGLHLPFWGGEKKSLGKATSVPNFEVAVSQLQKREIIETIMMLIIITPCILMCLYNLQNVAMKLTGNWSKMWAHELYQTNQGSFLPELMENCVFICLVTTKVRRQSCCCHVPSWAEKQLSGKNEVAKQRQKLERSCLICWI